jgi:pSer/pThr/pTyr-binding forkhead associated (FHA) protein
MELKLVLAKGEPKGKEITITKSPTVIGRDPGCDVVIASGSVSRQHCRVEFSGSQATISDLGSRNGILVNGRKVDSAPLAPGDRLVIGQVGFVVGGAAGARAPVGAEEDLLQPAGGGAQRPPIEYLDAFQASLEKNVGKTGDTKASPR